MRALRNFWAVVVALLVIGLPRLAFAADTALARLSDELLNILIPVVVAAVGALATWALAKFSAKTGIRVADDTADAWAAIARRAAYRGAEYARKALRGAVDGKKLPGPEVLEVAVNWAIDVGKAAGLPEMGRKALEGFIESELFSLRQEGSSSSEDAPKI